MKNKETKIYIVRHGQSVGNLTRTILGHTDLDLTELGREQAKACAEFLSDIKFDKIYSSDLKRALSTAKPHADMRNMPIVKAPELRELYFGDWDGVAVASVADTKEFREDWKAGFGTFVAPNGESVENLAVRVYNFILNAAKENEGETLLFVFHAAAIRSFWGKIAQINPRELGERLPFPLNASVSIALYRDGQIIPKEYSDASFIDENSKSIIAF
jgi:broad specificity phosphatase PhoE